MLDVPVQVLLAILNDKGLAMYLLQGGRVCGST